MFIIILIFNAKFVPKFQYGVANMALITIFASGGVACENCKFTRILRIGRIKRKIIAAIAAK